MQLHSVYYYAVKDPVSMFLGILGCSREVSGFGVSLMLVSHRELGSVLSSPILRGELGKGWCYYYFQRWAAFPCKATGPGARSGFYSAPSFYWKQTM